MRAPPPTKTTAPHPGQGKTLNHIACADRRLRPGRRRRLAGPGRADDRQGDVDNLGRIFQAGLAQPTFARMAALSRQINAFFAVWLPAWCAVHYPDTYTCLPAATTSS